MSRPSPEAVREAAIAVDPEFAKSVARWEIEVGEDWLGKPAVFVKVVLRDRSLASVWDSLLTRRRRLVEQLLAVLPDAYFPYVSFSAESVALYPPGYAVPA